MCITKQRHWKRVCGRTSLLLMASTPWIFQCGAFMCLQNWRGSPGHDSSVIYCCQFPVVVNTSVARWGLNNEWVKFKYVWLCHVRLDSRSFALFRWHARFSLHVNTLQLVHPRLPLCWCPLKRNKALPLVSSCWTNSSYVRNWIKALFFKQSSH